MRNGRISAETSTWKGPHFFKTVRFRLTLWYSGILMVLMLVLLMGINLAMVGSRPRAPERPPIFPGSEELWNEPFETQWNKNMTDLRNYSLIGVAAILVIGAVGGYVLSGLLLKPVDRVSSLASRISHTNLKERINYQGPRDEMKRLADTFDDMLGRLDDAFESQKQFVQDASHELKTPIATAQTNLEVLEMEENPTADDYRRTNEIVKRSLDRLNFLSQGLLTLSQGTQSQSRWSSVDLHLLLEEAVTEALPAAQSAGVSLEAAGNGQALWVRGDTISLKEILTNLIDNAIKYNQTGGRVRVSSRSEGSSAILEVRDTGIGLSIADQQRVFDRFYRVDKSRSRVQGGNGLGLAIVKKIAQEHGGTVTVESSPGQGSVFRVTLPLSSPEAAKAG